MLFNVTTYQALSRAAPAPGTDIVVWFPNWLGSVCFLIASYLAMAEVCSRAFCWPRDTESWIVAVNMVGSLLFLASALGGLVLPDGELVSARLVASGTFFGAVCFGAGALLLMREAREEGLPPSRSATSRGS